MNINSCLHTQGCHAPAGTRSQSVSWADLMAWILPGVLRQWTHLLAFLVVQQIVQDIVTVL